MIPDQQFKEYTERGISPQRIQAILQYAGKTVLDVCCGSGAYVLKLNQDYDIKGVDICEYPAWQNHESLFDIAHPDSLGFSDDSFDTILCFETLEHLQEPERALREFHRVCRKNIIITVPNCNITQGMKDSKLLYSHWEDRTHINFFTMTSMIELIEKAGFKIKKTEYIHSIYFRPFIKELFSLPDWVSKILWKILTLRAKSQYFLTILVVAEKISE